MLDLPVIGSGLDAFTSDADGDGLLELRWSGDVLGRVVETFVRMAPEVIDAEVSYADGTTDTLTGTPNHPFWVPAVNDYVALEDLEVGTVLRTYGGSEATVLGLTWKPGEVEVYDIEVEGLHNFFVRGPGSDAPGVLVHNSTRGTATIGRVDDLTALPDGDWTLLKHMEGSLGSPKANWKRNSGVLRREMGKGNPIRDASVDSAGQLIDHPSTFLNMERELLKDHGWWYDAATTMWNPAK